MSSSETVEERFDEHLTPEEREQRYGQFDHVRLYGLDYFHRLSNAGFEVDRVVYNDEITSKYGFMPKEEVVVCRKN